MRNNSRFNEWVRAWLLLPLSIVLLLSIPGKVWQRWQILHGTQAAGRVYRKLGKEGSGSSGIYHLMVKYQHPQDQEQYARVATDRSTHDALPLGAPVQVSYHLDNQNALLANEWVFSGKLLVFFGVGLGLLYDGWGANHRWRHRRRNGYLPD